MYIEDIIDLEEKYGWDAEVIACCVVIKDKDGKVHSYALNEYGGFNEVTKKD